MTWLEVSIRVTEATAVEAEAARVLEMAEIEDRLLEVIVTA